VQTIFVFLDKILYTNQMLSCILSNNYGTMTLVKDLALIFRNFSESA
jgi:hypothetical protein